MPAPTLGHLHGIASWQCSSAATQSKPRQAANTTAHWPATSFAHRLAHSTAAACLPSPPPCAPPVLQNRRPAWWANRWERWLVDTQRRQDKCAPLQRRLLARCALPGLPPMPHSSWDASPAITCCHAAFQRCQVMQLPLNVILKGLRTGGPGMCFQVFHEAAWNQLSLRPHMLASIATC